MTYSPLLRCLTPAIHHSPAAFLQLTPNSQFSKLIFTLLNGMPLSRVKNHKVNGMLPSQSKDAILKLKNVVAEWHATLMTY